MDTKLDEILKKVNESSAEIKEIKLKVETIFSDQRDLKKKVESLEKCGQNGNGKGKQNGKVNGNHQGFDGIRTDLEKMDKVLESIDNVYQFLSRSVDKQEKYMKLKSDEFTKDAELSMKNAEKITAENVKIARNIEDCLRKLEEKLEKSDLTDSAPKKGYRCHKCVLLLMESPRDDGVSVQCSNPNCREWNIVGQLQPGNKWVSISGCWHVQQVSIQKNLRETVNCQICGKMGALFHGGAEARVDHEAKTLKLTINNNASGK